MEDPQNQPLNVSPSPPGNPLAGRRSKKRRTILLIVAGMILIVAVAVLVGLQNKKPGNNQASSNSEKLFDDMLAAAAVKQKVHFTYAERKFESLAARESGTVSNDAYSVAEVDNTTKDFRAAYAKRTGSSTSAYYNVGRCLGGKVFSPATLLNIKTVQAAVGTLQQPLNELPADSPRRAEGCQLTDDPRAARLTDGIIPLGLSQQQTTSWLQHLKQSNFVQVKDEGTTTYKGTSVRKLRLTTNSAGGTGSFYESVKTGASLQLTQADNEPGPDAYRLDDIPGIDNLDGFYLVNETTKLPVYSEFVTASLLNNKPGFVFRQAYLYPQTLSLGQATTIDTLE